MIDKLITWGEKFGGDTGEDNLKTAITKEGKTLTENINYNG